MFIGLALLSSAVTGATFPQCDIVVGELVPNAQVARELAEAVIRNRQTPDQRSQYIFRVKPDGETGWIVFQALPPSPPNQHGNATVTFGGGGLGMRIDRCNGAMSEVYYQR